MSFTKNSFYYINEYIYIYKTAIKTKVANFYKIEKRLNNAIL